MADKTDATTHGARRIVPADLYETTPDAAGLWHWVLASPMLIFLAWLWVDLFAHYSPVPAFWLDALLGIMLYVAAIVLPLGLLAFELVLAVPRLFAHAGWDVHPLEEFEAADAPLIRFTYRQRQRAKATWPCLLARAGQGWVYLEIVTILLGGVLMVPVFFSATEFGFGRR